MLMMEILLGSVFLLMSILGYGIDKKLLNPLFIVPFIWGVLLVLFGILPHELNSLNGQFIYGILIWVLFFYLGGIFLINVEIPKGKTIYNKKIFNLYYYLVLIFAPLAIISLILEALKVGPEYFFLRLRMINTGLDEDDTFTLGKLAYVFNFTNVVCLLYTLYYEKVSKKKYYIVLLFALLLGLITLARTSLVTLAISIFAILYIKGELKSKHYIYFMLLFFAFIFLVTGLRNVHESEGDNFANTFAVYLFSSMPAFETLKYTPIQQHFGENTFRFFYAVANALGYNYEAKKTILDYVNVPVPTNVYTILYPFFKDFGYRGICVFGLIYGSFHMLVYKGYKNRNDILIIVFSIICPFLLLQFFSEYILSNFSTILQMLIISLIPYFLKIKK